MGLSARDRSVLVTMRSLTRRNGMKLAFSALWARGFRASGSADGAAQISGMIRNIPSRVHNALTGSQFAEFILNMDRQEREHAILRQVLEGNLPGFLRQLIPIRLSHELARGKTLAATVFVMPEYLAIGSDSDFLRIPMTLHTATAIADCFSFVLPTRKIVDCIYDQSTHHFKPQPLPPGPHMTSTEYYRIHNAMIDGQSHTRNFPTGGLVAGHKKDVVLTNRLSLNPGRIAIYGWHRAPRDPIQPLSTVHGARYVDYSHGIRLIARMAIIEGRLRSVYDILQDSLFAHVLSDEGAILVAAGFGNA